MLRQECEFHVSKLMTNADWVTVLSQATAQLNSGTEYPRGYIDCIVQKWARFNTFDIYDTHDFLQVHTMIRTGEIALFQVPIGVYPVSDKETDRMNSLLSLLRYPFSAKFEGGTQGSDGYFKFDAPINCILTHENGTQRGFVIAPAQEIPLEVGYQSAHKTLFSCKAETGVARWPYGHDCITVFVKIFRGADDIGFDELKNSVYGDFDTLPNPWVTWDIETKERN